jgi:hypothetical protein
LHDNSGYTGTGIENAYPDQQQNSTHRGFTILKLPRKKPYSRQRYQITKDGNYLGWTSDCLKSTDYRSATSGALMTTSTAAVIEARNRLNANGKMVRTLSRGYGPDHQYSRSRNVAQGMALSDIARNGFEVRCKETGIQFSILPGGSICELFTAELEAYWNSGALI